VARAGHTGRKSRPSRRRRPPARLRLRPLRRTEGGWAQGDTIKDETSGTFTTYYTDYGWYGTLTTLRAGRMYVVTSAEEGILTYAGKGECV